MNIGDIVQRENGDTYLITRVTKKTLEGRRLHPALPNGIGDVETLPRVISNPDISSGIWFGGYISTDAVYVVIRPIVQE